VGPVLWPFCKREARRRGCAASVNGNYRTMGGARPTSANTSRTVESRLGDFQEYSRLHNIG
jgi:hypothetical protein